MKLRKQAAEAASEVKTTAQRIGESVQWNTAALIAVTIVSVAALMIAVSVSARVPK